jgi:hypothetical protein
VQVADYESGGRHLGIFPRNIYQKEEQESILEFFFFFFFELIVIILVLYVAARASNISKAGVAKKISSWVSIEEA